MSDQIQNQNDIVKKVVDGSITINSIEEVTEILRTRPDNPLLFRAVGDVLVEKSLFGSAADIYRKAGRLFIDSGMMLQAIAAQIQEWSIIKSSERECRAIYVALRETATEHLPVYDFFARMAYTELVAVMEEMELESCPAGAVLQEPGDREDNMYFLISGVLRETLSKSAEMTGETGKETTENLLENNFFGTIYPFEDEKTSRSSIEAITDVELIKLSKSDLNRVSRKYPNIEFLTMDLCSLRSETGGRKALQMIRATTRYQLQTKVTLKIFPDNHMGTPLVLNGYTEDISLGGTCVRLGEKYWSGSSTDMVGKTVKLLINVPKASAGLDVIGTVVWRREVTYDERKTVLVGIQFNEMEEDDFDFLKRHCYIGEGEQDMIFSLWESFVKK